MALALFQPDIAGNVGTMMRLAACMAVPLHIIEPCGFPLGDRQLKRAAMDYGGQAETVRHADWDCFTKAMRSGETARRIIAFDNPAETNLYDFRFRPGDVLLAGSESAGLPDMVRQACDNAVAIPMAPGARSLNVATASAMALGEALRQTRFSTVA
ncbi:tRNA (cytidine(34)-2'-O)-methyltransferase [Alterisphingorhabdus coralli]|uniref:tRNA (cytidine(34)-2'-O)-methyltransferase n=1 Tax=Alterisphingorhabdus coralli TaxID=3071408 RepID=A0AA97FCS7_9SPHN|nr:tRNA (cytidine(34)-2'-O)-methyltransferase [Parasphingorhabdus sp. SCSIO 66989]WOE76690.1 tRNA (cytidine(34)-2'-O)-methyltransferase [Parasphingorhabdus sp. SCSIO 66989]